MANTKIETTTLNTVNNMMLKVESGVHQGKSYLFEESNQRYSLLRMYVKNRPDKFRNEKYFLASGLKPDLKWEFGNYSNSKPFTRNIPLPQIIYDIHNDKVYVNKGPLWTFK